MKTICSVLLFLVFFSFLGGCTQTGVLPSVVVQSTEGVSEPQEEDTDFECSYFYFLWGRYAELNGHFDAALEAYEKALICNPSAEYISTKIPILLLRLDRVDEAGEKLQEYLRKHPDNGGVRLLLAKIFIRQKSYDAAIEQYSIIHRQNPQEIQALLLLSELHLALEQFDAAIRVLQQVLSIAGENYPAHVLLARIYAREQNIEEALHHYNQALSMNWSADLELEVAELFLQNKDYAAAEELYKNIILKEKENEEAAIGLAHVYLVQGKEDAALEELNRLKSLSDHPERIELTIARVYARKKQYGKAVEVLQRIIHNDNIPEARYILGIIYFQLKKFETAIQQLRQIPGNADEYEDSVFLRVRLLRILERPDDAIAVLEEAIRDREVQNVDLYVLLATLYQAQGDKEKGEATFNRALSQFPENDDLLYEFGLFLDQAGRKQQALSVMKEVISRQPEHAAALNYVGYTWTDRREHLDIALQYIKRAVQLQPENGYIQDSLGWVYYRLGDLQQAQVALEKAVRFLPDDPAILDHLGDVYWEQGQRKKARSVYRKALEHFKEESDKARVREKLQSIKEQESP